MQAAQKKRQEEKNAKLIRELAALPANRNCFECGQRGPTYVNVTEGSFCCTTCSGILRGLNPPHRVKSISMASFTSEEIDRLRSLGNAENAKIWLGLYGGAPPAMTNRDAIQAFLVKKYEKKSWYISKADLSEQERLLNQAKEKVSQTTSHDSSSLASSSVAKPAEIDFFASDTPVRAQQQPPENVTSSRQTFSPPAWLAPPPPFSFDQNSTAAPQPSAANGQVDLLGLSFGATPSTREPPLCPAPSANNHQPRRDDPFADFDRKFNTLNLQPSTTVPSFNGYSSAVPTVPKSATIDSAMTTLLHPTGTVPVNPFQLQSVSPPQNIGLTPSQNVPPLSESIPTVKETTQADKYSALAELDELFHHGSSSEAQDGKPAWMPTGFSTGIPPSATAANLQRFPNSGTARSTSNSFGGFPKSQTIGAISDYGVNNPFLNYGNQSAGSFPNPFGQAQNQPTIPARPDQWNMPTTNSGMPPLANTSTAPQNWNPFL